MATRRRKVGNATYLEEYRSHRVNGKVVTEFVRYIGKEGPGKKVVEPARIIDRLESSGSRRAGDVDLLWSMAQDLDIPDIIDRMTPARKNRSVRHEGKDKRIIDRQRSQ